VNEIATKALVAGVEAETSKRDRDAIFPSENGSETLTACGHVSTRTGSRASSSLQHRRNSGRCLSFLCFATACTSRQCEEKEREKKDIFIFIYIYIYTHTHARTHARMHARAYTRVS